MLSYYCIVHLDSPVATILGSSAPSSAFFFGSAAPCTDQLRTAPPYPPPPSQRAAAKILQDPPEPAGLNKLTQSVAFPLCNYRKLTVLIIYWLAETSAIFTPLAGTTSFK